VRVDVPVQVILGTRGGRALAAAAHLHRLWRAVAK
jgi:hypothetical protein